MPALTVTANQKTFILDPMSDPSTGVFADALLSGVNIPGPTQIIPPFLTSGQWAQNPTQQITIDSLRIIVAAMISVMNFDKPGLGTAASPVVVNYSKSVPPGGNGTMTFIGGLLVAVT